MLLIYIVVLTESHNKKWLYISHMFEICHAFKGFIPGLPFCDLALRSFCETLIYPVAYPGILFGVVQQI